MQQEDQDSAEDEDMEWDETEMEELLQDLENLSVEEEDEQDEQDEPLPWNHSSTLWHHDNFAAAASPPPFWNPTYSNGRRIAVRVVSPHQTPNDPPETIPRVLVQWPLELCQRAYAPIHAVQPKSTLFGQVQLYSVLKKKKQNTPPGNDNNHLFELTDQLVAIKVHLWSLIQRHCGQPQQQQQEPPRMTEHPLHELAALQLVHAYQQQQRRREQRRERQRRRREQQQGQDHHHHQQQQQQQQHHVLACHDAIFDQDSETLNVILPYCTQGDMLDLIRQRYLELQLQWQHPKPPPTLPAPQPEPRPLGFPEGHARHWFRQIIAGLMGTCVCVLSYVCLVVYLLVAVTGLVADFLSQ